MLNPNTFMIYGSIQSVFVQVAKGPEGQTVVALLRPVLAWDEGQLPAQPNFGRAWPELVVGKEAELTCLQTQHGCGNRPLYPGERYSLVREDGTVRKVGPRDGCWQIEDMSFEHYDEAATAALSHVPELIPRSVPISA